jgi:hypothetical protein
MMTEDGTNKPVKPGTNDPRVLLLKMDDEQSAGLNLTNLNHVIFVHPLLVPTKQRADPTLRTDDEFHRYGDLWL